MPVQTFTLQEITVLQQGAQKMAAIPSFAAARVNMTKAEQKAADSATIQTQIDNLNNAITGIDDKYATLKANELTALNASLDFYSGLLTKIQNTPE